MVLYHIMGLNQQLPTFLMLPSSCLPGYFLKLPPPPLQNLLSLCWLRSPAAPFSPYLPNPTPGSGGDGVGAIPRTLASFASHSFTIPVVMISQSNGDKIQLKRSNKLEIQYSETSVYTSIEGNIIMLFFLKQ